MVAVLQPSADIQTDVVQSANIQTDVVQSANIVSANIQTDVVQSANIVIAAIQSADAAAELNSVLAPSLLNCGQRGISPLTLCI